MEHHRVCVGISNAFEVDLKVEEYFCMHNIDEPVKSPKPCRPRESGGPEVTKITGFLPSRG